MVSALSLSFRGWWFCFVPLFRSFNKELDARSGGGEEEERGVREKRGRKKERQRRQALIFC